MEAKELREKTMDQLNETLEALKKEVSTSASSTRQVKLKILRRCDVLVEM